MTASVLVPASLFARSLSRSVQGQQVIGMWGPKRAELIGEVVESLEPESVTVIVGAVPALAQFPAELERRISVCRH